MMRPDDAFGFLLDQYDVEQGPATEALRTLIRRDWAVRVLDAWESLERGNRVVTRLEPMRRWFETQCLDVTVCKAWAQGSDRAESRLAAAEAVWPELPEFVRAELGAKP